MENDKPLKWHWKGRKRICDDCEGEVLVFKEGEICSGCRASADRKGRAK